MASGSVWIAPYLAELRGDPYSAVRYIANRSIKTLPGFAAFDSDYVAPPADWRKNQESAMRLWRQRLIPQSLGENRSVLLSPDGLVDADRWNVLLRRRNNRSMDLQE